MVGPFLGPALAGYIGAGTNWRDSFGVLTAIYGLSTLMVLVFGAETYYNPGKAPTSRVGSYFGFGNTKLPKGSTLWHWCKVMVLYVFKFPLLMTGIAILVTFTWPIGKCFQQGGINYLNSGTHLLIPELQESPLPSMDSYTAHHITLTRSKHHPCVSLV